MNLKFWCVAIAVTILLLGGLSPATFAQSSSELGEIREEIQTLKEGQQGIQEDVAEIKKMLEAMQPKKPEPFKPVEVSLEGTPVMGENDAKVTIVEFTDYQCPFCARHFTGTLPQIVKNYVETGKVRYALREFPLTSIHPRATKASEAALCAGDQGKYWEMHDLIFKNQRKLSDADLLGHADTLALDKSGFETCLTSGKYTEQVKNDVQFGAKAGVRGTPSFVLGLTDPSNGKKFTATEFLRGAQPYAAFQKAIESLLAGDAKPADSGSE